MSSVKRDRNRKFCLQDDLRIRLDIHTVHVIGLIGSQCRDLGILADIGLSHFAFCGGFRDLCS